MTKLQKSLIYLGASFLMAFGGWAVNAASWGELLAVSMLPQFFFQIGSILIAWIGESPIIKKTQ